MAGPHSISTLNLSSEQVIDEPGAEFTLPPGPDRPGESDRPGDRPGDELRGICPTYPCTVHPDPTKCLYPCEIITEAFRVRGTNTIQYYIHCYYLPLHDGEIPFATLEILYKDGQPTDEDPLEADSPRVGEKQYPPSEHKAVRFCFQDLVFKKEAQGHKWVLRFLIQGRGRHEARLVVREEKVEQEFDIGEPDPEEKATMTQEEFKNRHSKT